MVNPGVNFANEEKKMNRDPDTVRQDSVKGMEETGLKFFILRIPCIPVYFLQIYAIVLPNTSLFSQEPPMEIRTVQTKADLKAFVDLPYRLYRHDSVWVAPLRDEQMGQYDPARNPMLDHCKTTLSLLKTPGNRRAGVCLHRPPGAGCLERAHRPVRILRMRQGSRCLAPAAGRRPAVAARSGDARHARPVEFRLAGMGDRVGRLHPSPVVMAPYNPPYYNDQLASYGLCK